MKDYCIGIDLGGTNMKLSIFGNRDTYGKAAERRVPTEVHTGSEDILKRMLSNVRGMMAEAGIGPEEVRCIGIGVPGMMDIDQGISRFSPNFPDWENVPVVERFERELRIPTFMDNDARVNLYGEWYFGAGRGRKNVVLLTLGTGLGSGIVMDGHVLYGATGSAGEIGHMNMYREGRPCRCGSSGCLGRYVSALGTLRTLKEKLEGGRQSILTEWTENHPERLTVKMISEAYDCGDKAAVETMQETGRILGFGMVNIINLYNPEMIIIGGGMSAAGERLLSSAREVVAAHALEINRGACEIVTAKLGDSAGMLGAAVYADQKLEGLERVM